VVQIFIRPAAVENCLQNVTLAVSVEKNEEKHKMKGHRLSNNQFQQLIINRQVLMIIDVSTMHVTRKGKKTMEEVLSRPVLSAHKSALNSFATGGLCHKLKCLQ
jgi:hypothetical protein